MSIGPRRGRCTLTAAGCQSLLVGAITSVPGHVMRTWVPSSSLLTVTFSTRPLMTASPKPGGRRSGSGSCPAPSGAGSARASASRSRSGPVTLASSGPTSTTSTVNRSCSSTRRITTGISADLPWLTPTAREHASPTARRTSSISSSETPARRATASATSRAVRTGAGRAVKLTSTVATANPPTASVGRREGLVDRGVDREDLGQARDPEDLENALLRAHEPQRAVMCAHPLEPADQHAKAGRVEEVNAFHVDHKVVVAAGDEIDQLLAQLRRRVDVDLPPDRHYRAVAFRPRRQGQVHAVLQQG